MGIFLDLVNERSNRSKGDPTVKQYSSIQHTLMIAFVAIAVIAVAAFWTGYAGKVNFSVGPDGLKLEIESD